MLNAMGFVVRETPGGATVLMHIDLSFALQSIPRVWAQDFEILGTW